MRSELFLNCFERCKIVKGQQRLAKVGRESEKAYLLHE
jgi:hypothetical protein